MRGTDMWPILRPPPLVATRFHSICQSMEPERPAGTSAFSPTPKTNNRPRVPSEPSIADPMRCPDDGTVSRNFSRADAAARTAESPATRIPYPVADAAGVAFVSTGCVLGHHVGAVLLIHAYLVLHGMYVTEYGVTMLPL